MKIYVKDFCQVVGGQWFGKEPQVALQDKVLNWVSIDSREINKHDVQSSDKHVEESRRSNPPMGARRWRVATDVCKHDRQGSDKRAEESRRNHSPLGGVFFAIKGARRDGHDFVWDVLEKNISVVVVCADFAKHFSSQLREAQRNQSVLICSVDNTLTALHHLARHWRQQNKWKVIGITGSAGKTTTKHFCQLLLERHFKVQSSPKSFNNYYGVPLALLSAPSDLDFFIQEIGMNQKGEIAFLSQMVQPDIVVVVQVGSSHIGLLGSKEEIAKEKEQIYHYTSCDAILIFNGDNIYTQSMYEKIKDLMPKKRILRFSSKDSAANVFLQLKEVRADNLLIIGQLSGLGFLRQHPRNGKVVSSYWLGKVMIFPVKNLIQKLRHAFCRRAIFQSLCFKAELVLNKIFHWKDSHSEYYLRSSDSKINAVMEKNSLEKCEVPVVGAVHLCNLMAAAAVAMAAGMTFDQIWKGLSVCHLPPGRNQWVRLKCGAGVLFDAYNASAESVMALLDHFLSSVVKGKRILILGDFLEMGSYLESFHRQLADRLHRHQLESDSQQRLHMIWFLGSQARLFGKSMEEAGWLTQNIVSETKIKHSWNERVIKLKQNTVNSVPIYLSSSDDLYLADKILSVLDPSFVLALKASRKMRMEKMLERWQPVDFHAL